ncbi:tRNA-dihydrouridine synthase family protein, partial [Patescibacteria group bacterium]|nr:tRNA-dihydrouridine synthase family protein [Patescibacteria group bacterium]
MFDWKRAKRPIIALSPMADMTDSAFCRIVKSMSDPLIYREMISSEAIVRGNEKTLEMAKFFESERPIIQQIFGSDPSTMAKAAAIVEQVSSPDGIDINMGCPVYKMTSNFNGAALMKDADLAVKIVKAVKQATGLPVSVKIRAGWSKDT